MRLRSEAPLLVRPAPGGVVHLVGGAAGPLGGDDLALEVVVGPGARLVVRGVAAVLAQPGPDPGAAGRLRVRASVGPGAALDWSPEPTVVVAGAVLELDVDLEAAATAEVRWREELVLGRTGEQPGRVAGRTRLRVGGRTVLDHALVAGGAPGPWDGPGGLAGHRWVGTELTVGPAPDRPPSPPSIGPGARVADLSLPGGAVLRAATAVDRRRGLPLLEGPRPGPLDRVAPAGAATAGG